MSQTNISNIIPDDEIEDTLLKLCSENSDVVFIVDGQRLSAQRSILSEKSEYFRALLLGDFAESKQNEIKLNLPLEQFKFLLLYIYSGSLPSLNFDERIEMLAIATEYIVPELISEITDQLEKNLNLDNVVKILNVSQFYSADKLWQAALVFVESEAEEFLKHESFKKLPSKILQEIIQRDSFYSPELNILRSVLAWRDQNPNEDFEPILEKIRFTLMSTNELLNIVKDMGLFTTEKLNDIVSEQKNSRNRPFRYVRLPSVNIATKNYIIQYILNGRSYDELHYYDYCAIGSDAYEIEFDGIFVLNNINFFLRDNYCDAYSYYIESSLDRRNWERIIDYSKYLCHSWQNLYFKSRPIRYLRFVGTRNTAQPKRFKIDDIQAMYSNEMPEIINGVCVPTKILEDNSTFIYFEEDKTDDLDFLGNNIRVALQQPYYVGSMRIIYNYGLGNKWRYYVETSVDYKNWIEACKPREGCAGILKFKPRPVIFVRLKFLDDDDNDLEEEEEQNIGCVEIELAAQNFEKFD